MVSMVAFIVVICVMVGSIARAIWGWLNSGEPFIGRKFAATMLFTIFAVALPVGGTLTGSSMIVDNAGMVGICVAALIAGWGADSGLKELGNMKAAVASKGKNATPV